MSKFASFLKASINLGLLVIQAFKKLLSKSPKLKLFYYDYFLDNKNI